MSPWRHYIDGVFTGLAACLALWMHDTGHGDFALMWGVLAVLDVVQFAGKVRDA